MNKKPVIMFTVCDNANLPYAKKFENSLRKFHSEKDLPFLIIGEDVVRQTGDPDIFYKQKPYFAKPLLKEYELVIGVDADQLVLGDLNHILSLKDYEVGTVLNYNRVDPPVYGVVQVWDIHPQRYYNCGLVAMRSERFVDHWLNLCNSEHFKNYRYREQDLLNVLCYYGNYMVRCFDDYDRMYEYSAWHGLLSKGTGLRMILKDGKVILPKADDNYPERDKEIKIYHAGGGTSGVDKMNYKTWFPEEIIAHIDKLVADKK